MVDRIRRFQQLNDDIFNILNKYLSGGKDSAPHAYKVEIEHFSPPKFDDKLKEQIARASTISSA